MAGADLRSSTKRDSVGDSTSLSNARLSPAQRLTPGDADGISIFEAVQQLGLKLERAKGGLEVLVIDHAEKPSAN